MDRNWNLDEIIAVMKAGGFYDRVMSSGRELDRVKAYLRAFGGEIAEEPGGPLQNPNYPCFPGLDNQPFFTGAPPEGANILEAEFETIRAETLGVEKEAYVRYAPTKMSNDWYLYLLIHMGVDLRDHQGGCPRTREIIGSLPRLCVDYPWGDAALSIQGPRSRLRAHCSVDNLRVRAHVAIKIPGGCGIRVGSEERSWEQGRVLLFDDSFEHEVWNRSDSDRLVLIVDFWNPGLTDVEIRALSAGFRKAEVRMLFFDARLHTAENASSHLRYLEEAIAAQDSDPLIREFWDA